MAKYVTWKAVEGESLDPFEVGDTLNAIKVEAKDVKSLKGGKYLLTLEKEEDIEKVLQVDTLQAGTKIIAEMHGSLNGCKCVIFCDDIKEKSNEWILGRLKAVGVTKVERQGELIVLTLAAKERPKTVQVGALKIPTVPYYGATMLCYKCYVYGHVAKRCRNRQACKRCGGYHSDKCPGKPTCRNCGGPHLPTYKKCPVWIQETAIQRLIVDRNLTGPKAREYYRKTHKKEYITPPKVSAAARGGPLAPEPEPEPATPAVPQVKEKVAKKRTKDQTQTTDTEEEAPPRTKISKPRSDNKSISSNLEFDLDLGLDEDVPPKPEKTVQEKIEEHMEAMRIIYGDSDEHSDDEGTDARTPTPAKVRRRGKGKSSRRKK